MGQYQFYLDSFQIMDTRSFHNDTIVAGLGIAVAGKVPQRTVTHQLGDFNNGSYAFWQKGLGSLDNVSIAPTDPFIFIFQIFNNGETHHPNAVELEAFIDRDLVNNGTTSLLTHLGVQDQSSGGAALSTALNFSLPEGSSASPGAGQAIADAWTGGLFSAASGIVKGCDGPLALGLISGRGQGLETHIPAQGPLRLSAAFKGTALKFGAPCNHSGSNYMVNIIIQRR